MAGSYGHIHGPDRGLSLLENLGDAYECIEELYFLVRALGTDEQIRQALDEFYRHKRGEIDADEVTDDFHEVDAVPSAWACAEAYKQSQALMDTIDG